MMKNRDDSVEQQRFRAWSDANISLIGMRDPIGARDVAQRAQSGCNATLLLVCHAPLELDYQRLPWDWPLTAGGERATSLLARDPMFTDVTLFAASPARGAMRTAEILAAGRPILTVADLSGWDWLTAGWINDPATDALSIADMLRRPDEAVHGREPASTVQLRVMCAVDDLVATYANQTIAVVSHGLALSLYIEHISGVAASAFEIW